MRRERAHFLFQADQGTIDARTWRVHAGWMAVLLAVLTAGWLVLAPYAHRDLKTTKFLEPSTIAAYTYLIVFAFAVLFIAISFYNLSAKRLRDRGEPTGLAGLLPLLALFSGAAHFIQPQVPDVIAIWYVVGLDVVLLGAVGWTVVALGFGSSKHESF